MKSSDNGDPGLNRGYSMHLQKQLPEGVVKGKSGKWLVRVKRNGKVISIAQYDEEDEAIRHYNKLKQRERGIY